MIMIIYSTGAYLGGVLEVLEHPPQLKIFVYSKSFITFSAKAHCIDSA